MKALSLPERVALAGRLRSSRRATAAEVTAEFLERHPDWLERYGHRAIERGEEDAVYHLEFLAAAIETGSGAAFENYARWCAGMLEARGIARQFVSENFRQLGAALRRRLSEAEMDSVEPLISAGCAATAAELPAPPAAAAPRSLPEQQPFLQAILSPNRKAAASIARAALQAGRSIPDIYRHLFQGSLYEVGRLWETNQITVAQEHMATAITQSVMALVYESIAPAAAPRGKMVVTGVEGEMHQIGAHMVADVLEADGWDVIFLGTNTPLAGVLTTLDSHQATALGISVTVLPNLPQVLRLVKSVRARWDARSLRIMLGGAALRYAPALATDLGADGVALDLDEAVSVARPWTA